MAAKVGGTEWSDDIAAEDIPLTARVVTTHIAKMPWGTMADGFRLKRMMLKNSVMWITKRRQKKICPKRRTDGQLFFDRANTQ